MKLPLKEKGSFCNTEQMCIATYCVRAMCIAYLHLQTDTLNAIQRSIATYCTCVQISTCVQMFTHCTHLCACSFLPRSVCRGQSVLFCTVPIHCTDELYLHSWSANSTECQHTSTTAGQSATNTQQRKNSPSFENVYDPLNNFQSTPFLTSDRKSVV